MKRHTLKQYLMLGALGVSFLAGCNQAMRRPDAAVCESSVACTPVREQAAPSTNATTYPRIGGQPGVGGYPQRPLGPALPLTRTPPPPQTIHTTDPVVTTARPEVKLPVPAKLPPPRAVLGEPVAILAPVETLAPFKVPAARVEFESPKEPSEAPAVATKQPTFVRGEPEPARKSYVDLTAAPCFSHAPDYNWIIGQVEYSRIAKEWRLRYASVDEVDEHGGRVILIENHHVSLLRDGQYVHVRGHVATSENASDGPVYYRIESFKTLTDPNTPPPSSDAE